MMSIFPIRSISHAVKYYEQSDHGDYYSRDKLSPSRWIGSGAQKLGVENFSVNRDRFARYLEGKIAGQILGNGNLSGDRRHPGNDVTLSAIKGASILALVGGDTRIMAAHDAAVESTIRLMEAEAAFTRRHSIDEFGRNRIEQIFTGNLLCAVYRHDTSRSLEPQLHSHVVVVNATQLDNGDWRSIESRHLYCLQKRFGLAYRQELASRLRELGYKIRRMGDASFEIEGIPDKVLSAFSSRRESIDAELEKIGYSRDTASSALKELLSKKLRGKKNVITLHDLLDKWRSVESQFGFDSRAIVKDALARSKDPEHIIRARDHSAHQLGIIGAECLSSLAERDSIFSKRSLLNSMNAIAVGYGIAPGMVDSWVSHAEESGRLLQRTVREYSSQFNEWREVSAFTTPEHYESEQRLLGCASRAISSVKPLATQREVESLNWNSTNATDKVGNECWNMSQQTALRGLLLSKSSVVALQGFAGTAKTTTVLRGYAEYCKSFGYTVTGIAPTASACQSLREGALLDSAQTVASHLIQQSYAHPAPSQQIWIVDEASLLSTRDLEKLLAAAERSSARVLLVGDIRQLGSIEAGAAFRQLQEFGIETFELDQILRQQNQNALSAVYASIEGEIDAALGLLQGEGGEVVEVSSNESDRYQSIVDAWMSLSHSVRSNTLIIDPSREGRAALTVRIREALKSELHISSESISLPQLERVDHTSGAKCDVLNYKEADYIRFGKAYRGQNVAKNSYWQVTHIDARKNILTIKDHTNREIVWNPRSHWGHASQTFRPARSELSLNDKLVWTNNDRNLGLTNGLRGYVSSIDKSTNRANVKFTNGREVTICAESVHTGHWSHDYVTTAHSAQGRTAERVIYHAESFRRNLASQKSFYVSISRAKHHTLVITDNRAALEQQIAEHTGEKQNAIKISQVEASTYDESQSE